LHFGFSIGGFMIFHHVLSVAGNITVLYRNVNGTEMMATLFGTEITNPLLQLRFFLRYGSPANPLLLGLVDWLFLILFTIMRIILGSMLLYRYMMHPRPDWIARFFACSIYAVSWAFWLHIVRYAFRKYIFGMLLGRKKPNANVKSADDMVDGSLVNNVMNEESINTIGDGNKVKKCN
jgi:TLC domain